MASGSLPFFLQAVLQYWFDVVEAEISFTLAEPSFLRS
jgi:hypothetical protein